MRPVRLATLWLAAWAAVCRGVVVDVRRVPSAAEDACFPAKNSADVFNFAELAGGCRGCAGGLTTQLPPSPLDFKSRLPAADGTVDAASAFNCVQYYPAELCAGPGGPVAGGDDLTVRFVFVDGATALPGHAQCVHNDSGAGSASSLLSRSAAACPDLLFDAVDVQLAVSLDGACEDWATVWAPSLPLPAHDLAVLRLSQLAVYSGLPVTISLDDLDGGELKNYGPALNQSNLTAADLQHAYVHWEDHVGSRESVGATVEVTLSSPGQEDMSLDLNVSVANAGGDWAWVAVKEAGGPVARWHGTDVLVLAVGGFYAAVDSGGGSIACAGPGDLGEGTVFEAATLTAVLNTCSWSWPSGGEKHFNVTLTRASDGASVSKVRVLHVEAEQGSPAPVGEDSTWQFSVVLERAADESGGGLSELLSQYPANNTAYVAGVDACLAACEGVVYGSVPSRPVYLDENVDAARIAACVALFPAEACRPQLPGGGPAGGGSGVVRLVFIEGTSNGSILQPAASASFGDSQTGNAACLGVSAGTEWHRPRYTIAPVSSRTVATVQFVVPVAVCQHWARLYIDADLLKLTRAGVLQGFLGCTARVGQLTLAVRVGSADQVDELTGSCDALMLQLPIQLPVDGLHNADGPAGISLEVSLAAEGHATLVHSLVVMLDPLTETEPPPAAGTDPPPTRSATSVPSTKAPETGSPAVPEDFVETLLVPLGMRQFGDVTRRIRGALAAAGIPVVSVAFAHLCLVPTYRLPAGVTPGDRATCLGPADIERRRGSPLLDAAGAPCDWRAPGGCSAVTENIVSLSASGYAARVAETVGKVAGKPGPDGLKELGVSRVAVVPTAGYWLNLRFSLDTNDTLGDSAATLSQQLMAGLQHNNVSVISLTFALMCELPADRSDLGVTEADAANADVCVDPAADAAEDLSVASFDVAWVEFRAAASLAELLTALIALSNTAGPAGMADYGLVQAFESTDAAPPTTPPGIPPPTPTTPAPPQPDGRAADADDDSTPALIIAVVSVAVVVGALIGITFWRSKRRAKHASSSAPGVPGVYTATGADGELEMESRFDSFAPGGQGASLEFREDSQ
ncbi:hypothetical protein DIPPA_23792 [Diplonema papillatum]|nr:hypothetical protein DIPPA_23792 [Diplonema papillatum]